jgi:lysine 2,3-aminomutase
MSTNNETPSKETLDEYTRELFDALFAYENDSTKAYTPATTDHAEQLAAMFAEAESGGRTQPIIRFFKELRDVCARDHCPPTNFGFSQSALLRLARLHQEIDEHEVTIGGRLNRAFPIVEEANQRVEVYLKQAAQEAASGVELWEQIQENGRRIRTALKITDKDWHTFTGQIQHCIDSVEKLARMIDLPADIISEVTRVTRNYRMRLTPYYASLIQSGRPNDPVLLQSVPTGEMVDNIGVEIPPVAADHSPARLVDQFYPRVVTIKATNMCAMYCTHCLRIAHIGRKDRIYADAAYQEALDYIRSNPLIRDVLVTGGDVFVLPNRMIKKILAELDAIDHVRMKRLGTRIPVTAPFRVDEELLDILAASNDRKPVRVVTQINTAQEITPVSRQAFKKLSQSVSALLNQAVLLKGINDTRVKMWKLCETVQESYVRPYYVFNCSYRNPQFAHFRVPIEKGRDIIESMYGNISGDAIPRYIATAGGKIPLHRNNVMGRDGNDVILRKPWNAEEVAYPDADPQLYAETAFAFAKKK